jgi:ATP-dependent Clp protease protease subunit
MHDHDHDEEEADARERGLHRVAERLFDARTVLIVGGIDYKIVKHVTEQLLAMAAESDDPIRLVVNSHGGHVESGDTIHDLIRFIKPRVIVIGTGWVASAGAHIFLAAEKDDRYCLPNTRFLLHQPAGGSYGQASDIEIDAEEIVKMRLRLNQIIADQTGQTVKRVEKDTDRNFWMGAEEAKKYGVVSHIVDSVDDIN